MRFVTVRTVDNSYQAHFIKNMLEDEGIDCIVTNENFTTLMPYLNGILGSGIQILVDKNDVEKAIQVIESKVSKNVQVCPFCNSKNIRYGLGTKHKLKKIIAIIISLVVGSTFRHIQQTYFCSECKLEF